MPAESSEATGPSDSLVPLTAAGATSDKIVGLFSADLEFEILRVGAWTDAVSIRCDVLKREPADVRLPRPALAGRGRSCEGFARRPRSHHDVINLARLEGIYRAYRSIEKRRLFLQEAPRSTRLRKNLQHAINSRNQFAAA